MSTHEQRVAVFWSQVRRSDGCWIWKGCIADTGYGKFWIDGKQDYVHRISYRLSIGPIPEGMQLDHLCRTHACVNPSHLEPVTPVENRRRGRIALGLDQHCVNGHAWTPENIYTRPDTGRRWCRACQRIRDSKRRAA